MCPEEGEQVFSQAKGLTYPGMNPSSKHAVPPVEEEWSKNDDKCTS